MKKRALIVSLLILLAACSSVECKESVDCTAKPASAFTSSCVDNKCVYNPIPARCGNGLCDGAENKCTCPTDCGTCAGKVPNSQYLTQQCVQNQCVEDVSSSRPLVTSADVQSAGDKFGIQATFNIPFNVKRDTFDIRFSLKEQGKLNRDVQITSLELTGTTKDKRTITLAQRAVDKNLFTDHSFDEPVILMYPGIEKEGELTNLLLKVTYEYESQQGGSWVARTGTFQNRFRESLIFVNPQGTYACPASCDDGNFATRDRCGLDTNFFCVHEPLPNTCGNHKCEAGETKCSCPQDCGECAGSAGTYLDYTCKANICAAVLKSDVSQSESNILDERSLGPVQLTNSYIYKNPFNIKTDVFELSMAIYRSDPSVSGVTIDTIRVLEGANQLASSDIKKTLGESPQSFTIKIPDISDAEKNTQISLGVWYTYSQSGQEKKGSFQKQLGKITLLNPS